MLRFSVLSVLALSFLPVCNTSADEAKSLQALIDSCAHCHSEEGKAMMPGWPAIADLSADDIASKLKGHRAGLMEESTMAGVSFDLSDEDIAAVAAYFAALPSPADDDEE